MGWQVVVATILGAAILAGDGPFITSAVSWSYLGWRVHEQHAADYAWKTRPMGVSYYA